MEKRYETRSGDLFVRSWARVRRVSLDRRSSAGETDGASCILRSSFNTRRLHREKCIKQKLQIVSFLMSSHSV